MTSQALVAMVKAFNSEREKKRHEQTQWEFDRFANKITKDFWKDAKDKLELKQTEYMADSRISIKDAIFKFRKEIRNFAHEKKLGCSFVSEPEHYYISLLPCLIYIQLEKETGSISVSTPNIATKNFFFNEWELGLKWIRDYLDIDEKSLKCKINNLRNQIFVTTKTAQIAITSINSLCNVHARQKGLTCRTRSYWLRTEVDFCKNDTNLFQIQIYHKAFIDSPALLIDLLKEPHAVVSEYRVRCMMF